MIRRARRAPEWHHGGKAKKPHRRGWLGEALGCYVGNCKEKVLGVGLDDPEGNLRVRMVKDYWSTLRNRIGELQESVRTSGRLIVRACSESRRQIRGGHGRGFLGYGQGSGHMYALKRNKYI